MNLTENMRAQILEHGFGADALDAFTSDELDALPVCPYDGENSDREDEWKFDFAQQIEQEVGYDER